MFKKTLPFQCRKQYASLPSLVGSERYPGRRRNKSYHKSDVWDPKFPLGQKFSYPTSRFPPYLIPDYMTPVPQSTPPDPSTCRQICFSTPLFKALDSFWDVICPSIHHQQPSNIHKTEGGCIGESYLCGFEEVSLKGVYDHFPVNTYPLVDSVVPSGGGGSYLYDQSSANFLSERV